MDNAIDFTNCRRAHVSFGGSDRKFGVIYNDDVYMLKFSDHHAKRHDISTSYVNNAISEYISSHISASIGLPTHETVLGTYNDYIVVGCKDFRSSPGTANIEFSEYVRAKYDSKDIGRLIRLNMIYDTLKEPTNDIPVSLQKATIERFWDTFVVDAFVGNFDRHIGNWGYLSDNNTLRLAPVYDYGSTLLPQLSDIGMSEIQSSECKMLERCLVFPSPALAITDEKVGKIGYYDMMSSNYDKHCTDAVLRIVPRIDMEKICRIVDDTPMISDVRKEFYKSFLSMRKDIILDRAYLRCLYQDFDRDAMARLQTGHQFSNKDLDLFLAERSMALRQYLQNEETLKTASAASYILKPATSSRPPRSREQIISEQREFAERYGLHSKFVWEKANAHIQDAPKHTLDIDR